MKKATKGALAAAAAGTLMVGGAGSLAYWTGTGTISGATIQAGSISMDAEDCTGTDHWDWKYGTDGTGADFGSSSVVVPGDVISKVCTIPITLEGDHIKAALTLAAPSYGSNPNTLASQLLSNTTKSFSVEPAGGGQVSGSTLTGADDYTVTVTVTVTFPFGSSADDGTGATTQALSATLNSFAVTATQVAS